jgi:hypothetical protein
MIWLASRAGVAFALISFAWLGVYFFGVNQPEAFNAPSIYAAYFWWIPLLAIVGLLMSLSVLLRKPQAANERWARWGLWLNLTFHRHHGSPDVLVVFMLAEAGSGGGE